MAKHRRFTDTAGYTRHCWECVHAKDWRETRGIGGPCAICEITGVAVSKYDSPNNPCCVDTKGCGSYDDGSSED